MTKAPGPQSTRVRRWWQNVHVQRTASSAGYSWSLGRSMVWDVEHELAHSLHASSAQSQGNNLSATLPGRISERDGQKMASR